MTGSQASPFVMFMKKLLLVALLFVPVFIQAQYVSDNGYYRVYNVFTERYVCVCDNTGSINISAVDAETGAIELWREGDEHSRFSDVA